MNELRQLSHPLSAAQSEIWLAETLRPGTAQYNIGECLEIYGPIDAGLFEAALRQVVAETEALNVTLVDGDDGPRQVLTATTDWLFPMIDLRTEPEPRAAAEGWMQADIARLVDPTHRLLFAYALLRLAPKRVEQNWG
jgi:nonribosomal peptide synthetase DhbF